MALACWLLCKLEVLVHFQLIALNSLLLSSSGLEIRWQKNSYTVKEQHGMVEVCAELLGTHSIGIPTSTIMKSGKGRAREGEGKLLW